MYRIIYFKDTTSLNDPTIYQNVLRIPEVFVRVRQAQEYLEQNKALIDLRNLFYLLSIGEFPSKQEVPKNLWHKITTILQVGLCDRHLKSQHQIPIFVANAHNDDAAKISSGLLSVKDVLLNSQSFYTESGHRNLSLLKPNETSKKNMQGGGYQQFNAVIKTSEDLLEHIQMYQISQIVVIGPIEPVAVSKAACESDTDWLLSEIANSAILSDKIEVIESINLDPLLFWFWKDHSKMIKQQKDMHKNSLFS